jgi:hypothetical protein
MSLEGVNDTENTQDTNYTKFIYAPIGVCLFILIASIAYSIYNNDKKVADIEETIKKTKKDNTDCKFDYKSYYQRFNDWVLDKIDNKILGPVYTIIIGWIISILFACLIFCVIVIVLFVLYALVSYCYKNKDKILEFVYENIIENNITLISIIGPLIIIYLVMTRSHENLKSKLYHSIQKKGNDNISVYQRLIYIFQLYEEPIKILLSIITTLIICQIIGNMFIKRPIHIITNDHVKMVVKELFIIMTVQFMIMISVIFACLLILGRKDFSKMFDVDSLRIITNVYFIVIYSSVFYKFFMFETKHIMNDMSKSIDVNALEYFFTSVKNNNKGFLPNFEKFFQKNDDGSTKPFSRFDEIYLNKFKENMIELSKNIDTVEKFKEVFPKFIDESLQKLYDYDNNQVNDKVDNSAIITEIYKKLKESALNEKIPDFFTGQNPPYDQLTKSITYIYDENKNNSKDEGRNGKSNIMIEAMKFNKFDEILEINKNNLTNPDYLTKMHEILRDFLPNWMSILIEKNISEIKEVIYEAAQNAQAAAQDGSDNSSYM